MTKALTAAVALVVGPGLISPAQADVRIAKVESPNSDSPHEKLRQKIFSKAPDERSCKTLETTPTGGLAKVDTKVASFVDRLVSGLEKKKAKELLPLYHERLDVGLPVVKKMLGKLESTYGAPFDVSLYRVWALNTVDGSPEGLRCADEELDGLTVNPQYGYPLHFGVWLQLMGQKELGRIFVDLVPANGRWNIGAFHAQQWTHAKKDYTAWAREAQKDAAQKRALPAFVKFDIAAKLLTGRGFLKIAMRDKALAARNQVMKEQAFRAKVKKPLSKRKVEAVETLLVKGGAGILVRLRVKKEIPVTEIKKRCRSVAKTLAQQPWHKHIRGVRCNFLLPGEDAGRDGKMGGLFLAFSDVKKKKG